MCEKGSYSLFNCVYLVTYNLTFEYAIIPKFGLLMPLAQHYGMVQYEGDRVKKI